MSTLGQLQIAQINAAAAQNAAPNQAAPAAQEAPQQAALPASADSNTWSIAKASTPVISTNDLKAPTTNVAAESQKNGTFVTYDQNTGLGSNRRALEIGKQGQNDFLETPIPGADFSQNPQNWVVTHKTGNTLYGFKKPQTAVQAAGGTPQTGALSGEVIPAQAPLTAIDKKQELIDNYFSNFQAFEEQQMTARGADTARQAAVSARQAADKTLAQVEETQSKLNLAEILDMEAQVKLKEEVKDRSVDLAMYNRMLGQDMEELSQDQRIKKAYDIYEFNSLVNKYNADLRNVNLLNGEYQFAMEQVQKDVTNWTTWQNMQLDLLTEMGQLEKEARTKYEAEINYERGLMMEGFVYVESTETYNKLVKDLGVTADTFSQFFYKDPGNDKIYLRPDNSKNVVSTINANGKLYGINDKGDIIKEYGSTGSFQFKENSDGSYSVFDPSTGDLVINAKPEQASFDFGNGTITAYGSPAWAPGLDFVLEGGKGAPVPSPIGGEVIFAGTNGGFGNQVKIRTEQGEELWVSHLDSMNVKVGDMIGAGTILGAQGNTGKVMGMNGQSYSQAELAAGKGTHLDLTIKKADGGFYAPQEVAELLGHKKPQDDLQNYLVEALGLPKDKMDRLAQLGLDDIQISNVAGIISGLRPPLTTSEMRTVGGQKTAAGLSAMGYDLSKANQDWSAMQKRLSSMNSTQQLRLSQAIFALEGSTGQAERLYADWQKTGLPGGFSSYNKAALKTAANLPGEAGVAARTLISHIEDMSAELAVIYRGGNTPTDMALEQARKSLDADWNIEQFNKNLALIRENLQIRKNSIANSSYIEGNIYNQSSAVNQTDNQTFFNSLNADYEGLSLEDLINSLE